MFSHLDNETVLLAIALLGLIAGSFLNVLIYRLPIMLQRQWQPDIKLSSLSTFKYFNLAFPSSHCINCKKPLKIWHNIPLLSYLLLRGKCAYCQHSIHFHYPLVEIISCLLSIIGFLVFSLSWQLVAYLMFVWILLTISFIDIFHRIIPDNLVFLLLWLGLLASIPQLFCNSTNAIIGAVTGYLFFAFVALLFQFLTQKDGLGQGDWKLLAALGAWFGWQSLPVLILTSAILGLIGGIIFLIIYRKNLPFPFAPYLAFAGAGFMLINYKYGNLISFFPELFI